MKVDGPWTKLYIVKCAGRGTEEVKNALKKETGADWENEEVKYCINTGYLEFVDDGFIIWMS